MAGHRGIDEPTDGSVVPLWMSHVSPKKRSKGKNKSKSTPSIPPVPMESPSSSLSRAAPQPVRPVEDADSLKRENELLRQSLQSLQRKFLEKNKQLTKERSAHHETSLSLIHEEEASKMNRLNLKINIEFWNQSVKPKKKLWIHMVNILHNFQKRWKKAKGEIEYLKERNNEKVRKLMTKDEGLANLRTVIRVTEVVEKGK
ncbi:hypothetical protein V865_008513 [Kwoniella europaea PYCC6329]|uniref:Uncharacterized protein n=1 Tax=Kwoniella europaea PYCC6329 TaxID=1423913 RepID=A0AAX4KVJ7_9TREE